MLKEEVTPPLGSEESENEPRQQSMPRTADVQRRLLLQRVGTILALLSVLVVVIYGVLFFLTPAWQILGAAGLVAVGGGLFLVARSLARRGYLDSAAYLVLATPLVVLVPSALFWAKATLSLALGALLLSIVLGRLVVPRRRIIWAVAAGVLAAGLILVIERVVPWSRFDVTQLIVLQVFIPAIIGGAAMIVMWPIARAFFLGTIRTRLLIAFVGLVLLPALVIGTASGVTSFMGGQRQVYNQLESVVTLKESAINTWLDSLQIDLLLALTGNDALRRAELLLQAEAAPPEVYQDAYTQLGGRFRQMVEQAGHFDEIFMMNRQGLVVLSSDPAQEAKLHEHAGYFQAGIKGWYVQPPFYSPMLKRMLVIVACPIVDQQGQVLGVIAGWVSMSKLNRIMLGQTGLGMTGETYLVGINHTMLTTSRFGMGMNTYVRTQGVNTALATRADGYSMYLNYREVAVFGVYHWLPELQVVLLAEQDQSEAYAGVLGMLGVNVGVILLSVVVAVTAGLFITRSIATPLAELAETAAQIADGDLGRTVADERADEVGALARAFNSMTARLRDLIGGLEARVAERTRELEQRSAYLEASAAVSRAASSILDREQLVQDVVGLIQERFGMYYVGLFLVDATKEWAVLQAGTGAAGRKMLAAGHRLQIGGASMIGQCVARSEARIALDVGDEAVRFDNPHLPETHSEVALPLRSRGEVLGALTIQSTQPAAFDQDTITLLQTMADQVAVALDNARLFAEVEQVMDAERRAYGVLSRQAWTELLHTRTDWGYDYGRAAIMPAQGDWTPAMRQAEQTGRIVQVNDNGEPILTIPLKVRDNVVGVLSFCKDKVAGATEAERIWTVEESALLETLTDQLSVSLERARLYQDTQRRAAREQLVGQVTGRMRESLNMDIVLQTAVREMRESLGLHDISIRLEGADVRTSGADVRTSAGSGRSPDGKEVV